MRYNKPSILHYRIAQVASWFVATFFFKRKVIRNEIKGKKGPFVVIANHQAAYDFVNLIGMTCRPMSFVISNSFYNSLPITGFLKKMGVIPKQQFQTTVRDMKAMKSVIDHGAPLVIYPAGLMCEDGLSTPIPDATYKFLKWLKADVYVARTSGAYFVMPKWAKGFRPGRTHLDIYKLFDKEELAEKDLAEIEEKTKAAILFDAYREQETLLAKYKNSQKLDGLEKVLYQCPKCGEEYTVEVKNENVLHCTACGYRASGDEYGFLSRTSEDGPEIRYVSDWSRLIFENVKEQVRSGALDSISAKTHIHMIDYKKHKFVEVGHGSVTLSAAGFCIDGVINQEKQELRVPVSNIPTLPFSPGKYLEIQQGENIYRCVFEDGKSVMKFVNLVKAFYELNSIRGQKEELAAR